MDKKNRNRGIWFNKDNHAFIEKKVEENNSNFNKEVNQIIKKERLETEKGKV